MNKDLIIEAINVLNTATYDYRAIAQQQREKGNHDNAADYERRAERCTTVARRLDTVGAAL